MPRSVLRIGTRSSAVALAQAESVRRAVQQIITRRNFELVPVTNDADEAGLPGGRAQVIAEIRKGIADNKIDLAVHNASDLPVAGPAQVVLSAITERIDPREALVTRRGSGLNSLKPGTRVGVTSSLRAAQVLAMRRGLTPVRIGGTLDIRLRALTAGEVEALVLPIAGLKRLGREGRAVEILPIDMVLPPAGQGFLAVECRINDKDMRAALGQVQHDLSRRAFDAERTFFLEMGGDHEAPIGALAKLDGPMIKLRGIVCSPDGSRIVREIEIGDDPVKVGQSLADRMMQAGAAELLAMAPTSA